MSNGRDAQGGGVSGFGIAEEEVAPMSGTGGGAGPGTRAGEGEPSGEGISDTAQNLGSEDKGGGRDRATANTPGLLRNAASKEAAAIGSSADHDQTSAIEYGEGDRPRGPTIGEALGSGDGSSTGSAMVPEDSNGTGEALASNDDAATGTGNRDGQSGE